MAYNLNNISMANTPAEVFIGVSQASNGYIGISILFLIFFSILIFSNTMRNRNFIDSLVASSFVTVVVSFLLLGIGLIEFSWAGMFVGLLILSLIVKGFLTE